MSELVEVVNGSSTAVFSPCERYRYRLTRNLTGGPTPTLPAGARSVTFCMLNPSTATASADDPTIRRCIGYARAWGYAQLIVVNVYGLRSTDPKGLWKVDDPVGADNDAAIARATQESHFVVAAWGKHAPIERVRVVLGTIRDVPHGSAKLRALKLNKDGSPAHPLYLKSSSTPIPWSGQ